MNSPEVIFISLLNKNRSCRKSNGDYSCVINSTIKSDVKYKFDSPSSSITECRGLNSKGEVDIVPKLISRSTENLCKKTYASASNNKIRKNTRKSCRKRGKIKMKKYTAILSPSVSTPKLSSYNILPKLISRSTENLLGKKTYISLPNNKIRKNTRKRCRKRGKVIKKKYTAILSPSVSTPNLPSYKFTPEKKSLSTQDVECKENTICITLSDSEDNANKESHESSFSGAVRSARHRNTSILGRNVLNLKKRHGGLRKRCKKNKIKNLNIKSKNIFSTSASDLELCKVASFTEEKFISEKKSLAPITECGENAICITLSDGEDIAEKESHESSSSVTESYASKRNISCKRNKSYKYSHRKLLKQPEIRDDAILCDQSITFLRPIVIDGSNVAIAHGQSTHTFSSKGIQLAIDYFLNRGHTEVTAFVPQYRRNKVCQHSFPTVGLEILEDLSKKQLVTFTPSREINGRRISSYDDRFIVELASVNGGIIVSNDNYRDLVHESKSFKEAIEKRLLMFCFVGDLFMVPNDPLGRHGPRLQKYLSFPPNKRT